MAVRGSLNTTYIGTHHLYYACLVNWSGNKSLPSQLVHSYLGEKVSCSRRDVFRILNFSSKDTSVQLDPVRGYEGCLMSGEGRQEDRRGGAWWVLARVMIWMLVGAVCV